MSAQESDRLLRASRAESEVVGAMLKFYGYDEQDWAELSPRSRALVVQLVRRVIVAEHQVFDLTIGSEAVPQ